MRSVVLISLLFSASTILAIAHFSALEFALYWQFPWLDIPMHALGGAIVALFWLFALYTFRFFPFRYHSLVGTLAFVLIVGLIWELFEVAIGLPILEGNFEGDLFLDLIMDLLGGVVGYFVGSRIAAR